MKRRCTDAARQEGMSCLSSAEAYAEFASAVSHTGEICPLSSVPWHTKAISSILSPAFPFQLNFVIFCEPPGLAPALSAPAVTQSHIAAPVSTSSSSSFPRLLSTLLLQRCCCLEMQRAAAALPEFPQQLCN